MYRVCKTKVNCSIRAHTHTNNYLITFLFNFGLDFSTNLLYFFNCINTTVKSCHLPREYSRIAFYFLKRGVKTTVEVRRHQRRCKRLCGTVMAWVLQYRRSNNETLERTAKL